MSSNLGAVTRTCDFLAHHAQQVENDCVVGAQNSIYFTVDDGKGAAESFSREKLRQVPQKEGGEKKKKNNSCMAFLLYDPVERCSLTSRINEMTTNKQNKTWGTRSSTNHIAAASQPIIPAESRRQAVGCTSRG